MGHESEPAFRATLPGQNGLVFWVLHLHKHAKPRGGRLVLFPLLVTQLRLVVFYNLGLAWNLLNKALLCLPDVKVECASWATTPQGEPNKLFLNQMQLTLSIVLGSPFPFLPGLGFCGFF